MDSILQRDVLPWRWK